MERNFEAICGRPYSDVENQEKSNLLAELNTDLSGEFLQHLDPVGFYLKDSMDKGLLVIADTIIEVSRVLRITEKPVVEFVPPPEDENDYFNARTLLGNDNVAHLQINLQCFFDNVYRIEYGFDDKLREIVAHEMYHIYTMEKFPATTERMSEANKPGNDLAYQNDRGERAARLFASQYYAAKFPNQISRRHAALV